MSDRLIRLVDGLNSGSPRGRGAADVDAFLRPLVTDMKAYYRETGNPTLSVSIAIAYADRFQKTRSSTASFQYARLLSFVGEMLLAEGTNSERLSLGLAYLESSAEILLRLPIQYREILKAHVSVALYRGVTLKALGQYDESIRGMRREADIFRSRYSAFDVDLVMLTRQEVLMRQESRSFSSLIEDALTYRVSHPNEYYATIKRTFEFLVNTNKFKLATELYPQYLVAFRSVKSRLPLLSHISFSKNIGYFLSVTDRTEEATRILRSTLRYANALNLRGQERQISALLDGLGSGTQPILQTFRVS
jgi:hypothetical protein